MNSIEPTMLQPDIALEERIAVTNLSEVWRGRRASDGAEVAVKFALSPAAAAMLQPEADTVRALQAACVPWIVPAEYVASPVPHLVFPWKGRRTFRDVIDGIATGDDRARAAAILFEVVHTVALVQQAGFQHGDLKPENILVDDDGRAWLTDFGMARAVHAARLDTRVKNSMDATGGGGWGGTLHYLPPEGLQGEPPAASWDVYALGVILHEVLLGKRPDRAASPESLKAVLPAEVVDVLLQALAYSPDDRIPNVPTLSVHLAPVAAELTRTGAARLAGRAKRRALAGLAAFFVALRYLSVLALLAGYASIALLMRKEPSWIFAYVPFAILHCVVRWEGPESGAEAIARRTGEVFVRQK